MQNILEELYYGNIRLGFKLYGKDSHFMEAARLQNQNLEKLREKLDDSEKELFEKYCDAQGETEDITRYDLFVRALRFGILLMAEAFMGGGESAGESR